ncbi:MAG: tetratricopeptide repeat protein [Opitutaceae bacterium]
MPQRVASPLRTALIAILLAGATLLLFSRSAGYGFVNYDDPRHVLNNFHVQAGFTAESLRWAFTGHGDIWNPLVRLSHILDWTLFGASARGHHVQSMLWHALNAALAFLLLRRLTGAFWTSAFCAALFAWHPLRVESVTWISERKDVVSVAFGLLTLLAYARYAEHRAAGANAATAYMLTLAAMTAALLSKPSMVALPAIFLLLDFWPLRRCAVARPTAPTPPEPEPVRRLLLEKLPFVALAAVASIIVVRTQTAAGDFVLDLPLGARLGNALVSVPRYLGKFLWPFDLAVAYPHPGWWPAWIIAAAGAFVLAVSVCAWRTRRSHPWIAVGWLWFLAALAPMSGVLQVGFQSLADRYSYFPLLGWQIALLWTLRSVLPRILPRLSGPVLAGLALLGCGLRTWDQQQHWSSSRALYEHALAVTKDNAPAHAFLAYTSAAEDRSDDARHHSARALALDPDNSVALLVRARLQLADRRTDDAIATFRHLLRTHPGDWSATLELARTLYEQHRLSDAADLLATIPPGVPEYVAAQAGRSRIAFDGGHPEAARDLLADALAGRPAEPALLVPLCTLLQQAGRTDEALALFVRARVAQPTSPDLALLQSDFLRNLGRHAEALSLAEAALKLDPHYTAALRSRAQLLATLGRADDSLAAYETLLRAAPSNHTALFEAGLLREQRGDAAGAIACYRRAATAEPRFVDAQLALARLAEAQGHSAEADSTFARALAAVPDSGPLHRAYADVLGRRRDFAGALLHYRRAVELLPNDPGARAGYGYLLFFNGEKAAAAQEWEIALRLDPNLPGLRAAIERAKRVDP